MNRLLSVPQSKSSTPSPARTDSPQVRGAGRGTLPQCLLVPQHYERNYAYPLVVWMHGVGGDERELKRIMPLVSLRNYVSVAVRGTSQLERGFGWEQTGDAIAAAESRAAEAVAQARQRFNIHDDRI